MLAEIWNFIAAWAWYALLGCLAAVIPGATAILWQLIQRWLDKYYADDLPEHAGAFTRAVAARRWETNPPKVLCVADKTPLSKLGDAFAPSQNSILLSQKTFFKQDPTFWAIGAHELGHAILYEKAPWFVNIVMIMRHLNPLVSAFAMTVLLANIFFGNAAVLSTALGLFWVVVIMSSCVCIDELAASWIAVRLLREDGRLRKGHWLGVYGVLATALMTYVGAAAGSLVVVLLYDALAASSVNPTIRPEVIPLSGIEIAVGVGLALLLLGAGLHTLLNIFGHADHFDPGLEIGGQQIKRVEAELKQLEEHTGPDVEHQRAALNLENTRLLKRYLIRMVKTGYEYAALLILFKMTWNVSNEGFFLAFIAIAFHRAQVVLGLFLIPVAIVLGLGALITLLPIIIPLGIIIYRLDESLKSDNRQKEVDAVALANESAASIKQVQQWKEIWRMEHRLARFPEIVHLPFAVVVLVICGQTLFG